MDARQARLGEQHGASPRSTWPTSYSSPTLAAERSLFHLAGLAVCPAYATQSDSPPGNTIDSGTNQANYFTGAGYSVTQSGYDPNQNYLTDAGAFSGSGSFYGTFDQSGNVYQWNDLDGTAGSSRGLRGGNWNNNNAFSLSSSDSLTFAPANEANLDGFRLASPVAVPEPSTWVMGPAGLACGGWQVFRRRRRSERWRCFT